ncbi:Subtilisin-like protease SBT1.7 [Vitis vinifera]|uniref:Subtilisin-like protease SBT1.7 n=1 Tax=Vitis vinifera TaxID=29760 RepID=A0A438EPV8_VITVI|nr:Subtilisin-like protease SBT1.7 [Vitis vinifera]
MECIPYKLLFLFLALSTSVAEDLGTYIIHMDKSAMPMTFSSHHDWYRSTLSSMSSPDGILPTHLYTYNHVLDGFSAVLSRAHLDQLEKMAGHLATYPDSFGKLHTTHTPKFLGLEKKVGSWPKGKFGEDMIIGILDSGIWPESESFKDKGMAPVPDRWRGACESGVEFNSSYCNRKLIGARSFSKGMKQRGLNISLPDDYDSPRDFLGHGLTHRQPQLGVHDSSDPEAAASDTLAGMDQAIADAGNAGPHGYTIFNGAPWITTIGAGTIDRDYAADVTLGNGILRVRGKSVYPEDVFISNVPLYFGHGNASKETCDYNALEPQEVAGKIVFCDFPGGYQQDEIERVGAAGAIFKNPVVDIKFQKTVLGAKPAPQVAWFSSRGPSRRAPMILKPDILAPGVDILAAWAPNIGITPIGDDYLLTDYALLSGTSMASPHAVGVAALLKSAHPDWSPAAIRSAMMTTAYLLDNTQGPIMDMTTGVAGTPLDFGAGHINPNMAMDPGLVYDIEAQDYINFLCGLNYTSKQIKIITRRSKFSCDQANLDLNYPSFMVLLNNTNTTSYTFKRVLTNVENTHTVYHASVKQPSGMKVSVQPSIVSFAGKYSKAEFNMTVEINLGDARPQSDYIGNFGYLSWWEANGTHVVSSPIVSAIAPIIRT